MGPAETAISARETLAAARERLDNLERNHEDEPRLRTTTRPAFLSRSGSVMRR